MEGYFRTVRRPVTTNNFERNPFVSEYAKRWANGICQHCEQSAPFNNKKGEPHLHTHHIVWLAKGGEDSINNTVALCPNCHDRMHILDFDGDIVKLKDKVKKHLST
jgi:5-methylcytosine-specific restriction enzyme A